MTDTSAGEPGKHPIHGDIAGHNASLDHGGDDPGPTKTFGEELADLIAKHAEPNGENAEIIADLEGQVDTLKTEAAASGDED